MKGETELFRMAFRPIYCWCLFCTVGILVPVILVTERLNVNLAALASAIGLTVLLIFPLTVAVRMIYPVSLSATGVRSSTFWGNNLSVPWEDIERVTSFNMGLRYLVIHSPKRARVYVPTFLDDPELFRERVTSLAGPTHPLSEALRD